MAVFSVGDRVVQAQYGTGTVTGFNEYHTVIDFDEHGSRTFKTTLVRLERSATAAPPRKGRRKSPTAKKAPATKRVAAKRAAPKAATAKAATAKGAAAT